jgi:hypothetical protein
MSVLCEVHTRCVLAVPQGTGLCQTKQADSPGIRNPPAGTKQGFDDWFILHAAAAAAGAMLMPSAYSLQHACGMQTWLLHNTQQWPCCAWR